jgi:hypothetical protein
LNFNFRFQVVWMCYKWLKSVSQNWRYVMKKFTVSVAVAALLASTSLAMAEVKIAPAGKTALIKSTQTAAVGGGTGGGAAGGAAGAGGAVAGAGAVGGVAGLGTLGLVGAAAAAAVAAAAVAAASNGSSGSH